MARLGDLIQSLPAIESLRHTYPQTAFDVLCAAPLADLVRHGFPVRHVVPWDGAYWRERSDKWVENSRSVLKTVDEYLDRLNPVDYDDAFVLNQHDRAILAAHLLAKHVVGAGQSGPLTEELVPWTRYLRMIAGARAHNRVHLADAFCGLCGQRPLGRMPKLRISPVELPGDLGGIGSADGFWVAVVVGAGDSSRCVPCAVWSDWITHFLITQPEGRVVLVGSGLEREMAQAIQSPLSPLLLGRIWDTTGRTDLMQLVTVLSRVAWVIGADTGPLHLGTALGARALGLYFSRARVHETGPYGEGHRIFQHHGDRMPDTWPVRESVQVIVDDRAAKCEQWDLWQSGIDEWGAFFSSRTHEDGHLSHREDIWRQLSPSLFETTAP